MLRDILQHLITAFANYFKDLLFVSMFCLLFLCISKIYFVNTFKPLLAKTFHKGTPPCGPNSSSNQTFIILILWAVSYFSFQSWYIVNTLTVQRVKLQRISPPCYLQFVQFYFITHHPWLWGKNDKRSPSILIPEDWWRRTPPFPGSGQ